MLAGAVIIALVDVAVNGVAAWQTKMIPKMSWWLTCMFAGCLTLDTMITFVLWQRCRQYHLRCWHKCIFLLAFCVSFLMYS
jgi:hypothetical protein